MKSFFCVLLILITFFFTGCQPASVSPNPTVDYSQIAGTWKAEKGLWEVTISEDGKVLSANHPLGDVQVKPNETTQIEMKDGKVSTFKGGDFSMIYISQTRELEVTIIIKEIHVKFMNSELSGKTETTIGGFISEDFQTWDADVIQIFDYGDQLPQGGITPRPTKFRKISDEL